jgi:hypothetical protein
MSLKTTERFLFSLCGKRQGTFQPCIFISGKKRSIGGKWAHHGSVIHTNILPNMRQDSKLFGTLCNKILNAVTGMSCFVENNPVKNM